jgi:hypothetical protein
MPLPYDTSTTALFQPERLSAELPLLPDRAPTELALAAECARLAYLRAEQADGGEKRRLDAALVRLGLGPATLFAHAETHSQAFGTYRAGDGLSLIAVRGTQPDALQDTLTDASIQPVPPHGGAPGRVHRGFRDAAAGLLDDGQITRWLAGLPAVPARRLVVCGHSLGAAVASLLAAPLAAQHLVTLGSPRLADAAYGQFLAGLPGLTLTRVVDGADLVTMLPPALGQGLPDVMAGALRTLLPLAPPGLTDHAPGLGALLLRLAALPAQALPYRHLGQRLYIDHDGALHQQPDDDFVRRDQLAAITQLPPLGLAQVPTRLLSDHAPINYLRALWPG